MDTRKRLGKKLLAWLVVVTMLTTLVPTTVFAGEEDWAVEDAAFSIEEQLQTDEDTAAEDFPTAAEDITFSSEQDVQGDEDAAGDFLLESEDEATFEQDEVFLEEETAGDNPDTAALEDEDAQDDPQEAVSSDDVKEDTTSETPVDFEAAEPDTVLDLASETVAGELIPGEDVVVTTTEGAVYYAYTPAEDGVYTVYSYLINENYYDTYVEVYDNPDFNDRINYNDDGSENNQFKLTLNLTAGTTYYFGFRLYSGGAGTFGVRFYEVQMTDVTFHTNTSLENAYFYNEEEERVSSAICSLEIGSILHSNDVPVSYQENDQLVLRGWSVDSEAEEPDESIEITEGLELYGVWVERTKVTFHANFDDENIGFWDYETDTYIQESVQYYTPQDTISKWSVSFDSSYPEDYSFIGWATDPDAEEAEDEIVVPQGIELDLYAVWKPVFSVTYNADASQGGYLYIQWDDDQEKDVPIAVTTDRVTSGETFSYRDAYNDDPLTSFEGWFDEDGNKLTNSTVVTGDLTATAHWKKTQIIDLAAGVERFISEEDSANYFRFTVPEDGYYRITFNGADDDLDMYIARYNQDYSDWGSCSGWGTAKWLLSDLTKDSVLLFRFGEDYDVDNPISGTAMILKVNRADVTFHANHEHAYYHRWDSETHSYVNRDTDTQTYEEGEMICGYESEYSYVNGINVPDHDDSIRFQGWTTNPEGTEHDEEIILGTENIEVYAVWKEMIPVTFNLNNSEAYFNVWNSEKQQYEELQERTGYFEDEETFGRYSYYSYSTKDTNQKEFVGWSLDPNASEPESSITVTSETTLYGVWKNRYTVTYEANGGKIYDSQTSTTATFIEGQTFSTVSVSHSDPFMALEGWFDAAEGGTKYDTNTPVTKDVTVYAHWKKAEPSTLETDTLTEAVSELNKYTFEFTPDESGTYVFNTADSSSSSRTVVLYDEEMNPLDSSYGNGDNSNIFLLRDLEAGKKYTLLITDEGTFHYPVKIEKVAAATVTFDANLDASAFSVDQDETVPRTTRTYVAGQNLGSAGYPRPIQPTGYLFKGWSENSKATRAVSNYNLQVFDGMTLYAVWEKLVPVTLDSNHENAFFENEETTQVIYLSKATSVDEEISEEPSIDSSTGLIFAGWSLDPNAGEPDAKILVNDPVTVYAVWKDAIKVTFHANREVQKDAGYSGYWDDDDTYVYQQTIESGYPKGAVISERSNQPESSNEDIIFAGWSVNPQAEEPDKEIVVNEPVTVYAVWKNKVIADIQVGDTIDVSYRGSEEVFCFTPEEDGSYVLFSSGRSNDPYANLYDENQRYLKSDDDGGGNLNFRLSYDMKAGKKYYYHLKDYSSYSTFRITLTKVESAKVTFDCNIGEHAWYTGVNGKTAVKELSLEKGAYVYSYTAGTPQTDLQDKSFAGWATSPDAAEAENQILITGDITVYAVWKDTVTVTFDVNRTDGAAYFYDEDDNHVTTLKQSFAKGETLYTDSSYDIQTNSDSISFLGWSENKDATEPDQSFKLTDTTTLYAVWSNKVEILYDANGGFFERIGVIYARKFNPGAVFYSYQTPVNTDKNKVFAGWATTKDAKTPDVKVDQTPVDDLNGIVYAVWKNVYTVAYDVNGGVPFEIEDTDTGETIQSDTKSETYIEGRTLNPVSVSHEDAFMSFEGWFDAIEGGKRYDSTSMIEQNVTLFARWRKLTETGLEAEELETASSDISSVLYQFIPSEDGYYVFNSADARKYYPTVKLYDSTKKLIASNGGSSYNGNFLLISELKKGQTYYYTVSNEKDGAFSYPLKIAKAEEAAVTFDANRDDAVIGISGNRTWQTKAAVGYRIHTEDLKVTTTSDKELRLTGWSKDPKATTPDSDLTIRKDTTLYGVWKESVKVTFHVNNDQAFFEDPEDDEKMVSIVTRTYDAGVDLLDRNTPDIGYNASGKQLVGWSVNQNATTWDSEILVTGDMDVYAVWSTSSSMDTAEAILVGETKDAVTSSYMALWYSFTPEEDGAYALESSERGSADPYVELYDADSRWLEDDDDGGEGLNFFLARELKAGNTYYYRVSPGTRAAVSFKVTLTRLEPATVTLYLNRDDQKAWFSDDSAAKLQTVLTTTSYIGAYLKNNLRWTNELAFLGWSEDPNAASGSTSVRVTKDNTYYAIWSDIVSVTLDANRNDAWYSTWDSDLDANVKTQTTQRTFRKGYSITGNSYSPSTDNPEITFLGWSISRDATEPDAEIILNQSGMTLYGVWREKAFITFDANGGFFENVGTVFTQSYNYPDNYLNYNFEFTPDHTDPKLLFAGWAKTPQGDPIDTETTRIRDLNVLYAVWKEGIQITFNANTKQNPNGYFYEDGRQVETMSQYVLPGSTLGSVYYSARSDNAYLVDWGRRAYSAGGEILDGKTVLKEGDVLFVRWTELVDVTFDAGTGTLYDQTIYKERWAKGTASTISKSFQAASSDPSKVFVGWSTDGTAAGIVWTLSPTTATTLKAVYLTGPKVTIAATDQNVGYAYVRVNGTYLDNESGALTFIWAQGTPKSEMVMGGGTYQEGKIFVGFSTTEDGKNLIKDTYYPTAAITLYPVFADGWFAEFYANGGNFPSRPQGTSASSYLSVSVKKGDTIGAVETPVYEGKTFAGWRIRGTETVVDLTTYSITGRVVFEAVWSEKPVELTGIAFAQESVELKEGQSRTLSILYTPANANNRAVSFSSGNEEVAVVDASGIVTAKSAGTAQITAVSTKNKTIKATCQVTVTHNVTRVEAKAATCTETGTKAYYVCSVCGKYFEDEACTKELALGDIEIPAAGHNWGEWTTVTEATETEDGLEERVCATDPTHKETRVIPAKNHEHVMTHVEAKAPTLEAEGNVEYWICSECGNTFKDALGNEPILMDQIRIPKLLDISKAAIADINDCVYSGAQQKPKPEVRYSDTVLKEGTDYEMSYTNNTNAGTATITYTGKGLYGGTTSKSFTINKKASTVTLKAKSANYTGKSISIGTATVTGSSGKVSYSYYSDAACTKTVTKHVNAGTYYVKGTVAEDTNYEAATSKAVKLTIKQIANTIKASGKKVTLKAANVKKKNQTIKKAKAFTISKAQGTVTFKKTSGNKNITVNAKTGNLAVKKGLAKGTYKVKISVTAKGTTNYKSKTVKNVTVTVVIK